MSIFRNVALAGVLWLVPACQGFSFAQAPDVASLVHPEMADRISLDDVQRATIQKLVQDRAESVAKSESASAKEKANAEYQSKILAVLNDDQRARFLAAVPPKKLTFQFHDMKWDAVLQWFADQQGLTLVMDRVPPETFSYSDTRAYTPAEGIDLLNSVLMTRNFSLVRREKMLVVMELTGSIPLELLPRVKIEDLAERGRFELVSVVFVLGGRPIEMVLQEVKPMLSSYGRAVPLAQGNQLLVVETAGKMRTIHELITLVPLPKPAVTPPAAAPPPKPVFASYTLSRLDAARTLETIRKLIPSEQITVDPKTGVLSAFVIPDQQAAIKSALEQMIANASVLPSMESVAFQLSGMTIDEFKKQILSLSPNATITASSDRVLVLASPQDQKQIRESLAAIDVYPVDSTRSMKVFEMESGLTPLVESALKSFLPKSQVAANAKVGSLVIRGSEEDIRTAGEIIDIWKRSQSSQQLQLRAFPLDNVADAKWLATVQKIVPSVNVWLGDDGRQLMLLASAQEIAAIEATLPQLMSLLPKPDQRQLKIYLLTKNQLARRSSLSDLPPRLEGIKVVDGSNKQELLVWATPEQHSVLAEHLQGLDIPMPVTQTGTPKIFPLEMQDTALLQQLLSVEFPEAKLSLDANGTSLTVIAEDAVHPKIAARIDIFNQQLPKRTELKLENYSVQGMSAAVLQQTLSPLLSKARVNVDPIRNRLLVSADSKTHQEIAELIKALEENVSVDQQPVVIPYALEHALPSQVKLVFDQLGLGAQTIADDKLKQLVVTGTIQVQSVAKAMIAKIDRPADVNKQVEIRSFETKKLQAATLALTLQKLWPELQISADTQSNRIVASGASNQLDQLNLALERLVSSPDGKPQIVKTYPVPSGDMQTLPTILGQIAPQAIISSDLPSRTLTVWANEEQQVRVEQALEQISRTAQANKEAATYLIKPTQIAAVQTSLQSLFPTAAFASVPASGQLIVVATPEQQTRIAEVIELLASGPNAAERTVRVFQLDPENIDQASFLVALQATISSQVRIESNLANHTLLAVGTPDELEIVASRIEELRKQMPQKESVTSAVYTLKHAGVSGAIALLQPMVPRAVLVQDPATRTIAATARAIEHRRIDEFLKSYDLPRELATYLVKPTQLVAVQSSLRTLFPLVDITADPTSGQIVVVAAPEQQKRISEVIKLMASGSNADQRSIKVFRADPERLDPTVLLSSLQATLPSQIRFESNARSGTFIAIGTPEELALVAERFAKLEQDLPQSEASVTSVYPLKFGNSTSALTILQSMLPRATLVQDVNSRTIAATARPHEHRKIQEFLKAFDVPKSSNLETHVYRLHRASARGLALVLDELMPEATIYGSREEGVLIATATPEQHKRIESIVKDFDIDLDSNETRVFAIRKGEASSLRVALQGSAPKASVTADPATNSLIVTAPATELERIEQIIQEVEAGGNQPRTTSFYSLNGAEPLPLSRALKDSFPKVTFAPDSVSGGIFATATATEHAEVAKVIGEVNAQPTKLPSLQAFRIQNGKPEAVAQALQAAFGRRSTAGVTFSQDTKSVFVVGGRQELEIAEQMVKQFDVPEESAESRRMKVFSIHGADGKSLSTAIEGLFSKDVDPVSVRYDSMNGQLFVTGTSSQLKSVEEAVQQLTPPPRDLEFIQLNNTDPFAFKQAADALFMDEPISSAPAISVDYDQQQLIVRATKEQLVSIRKLLGQMGESQGARNNQRLERLRIINVPRSSEYLLQELNRLWPTLRQNPIKIVNPNPIEPTIKEGASPSGINEKSGANRKIEESQNLRPAAPANGTDSLGTSAGFESPYRRLISTQLSPSIEQFDAPKQPVPLPPMPLPPIIVVPTDNQWTIASEDAQGLDLFARLIDSIINPKVVPFTTAGNFSVYMLRHADAERLQKLLTELFDSGDKTKRGTDATPFQRVKIVADTHINALVIGGQRSDRKIVEELLAVFDSEELLDTLQQIKPTIVYLKVANAKNVLAIVSEVYQSQLKAGAGRSPVDIPEGVSSEVAVVLQEINAQSVGPLLTVAMDEASNSIVLRGPPGLTTEIGSFIDRLDQPSEATSSKRIQLLRLESTNTKNLEKALNLLRSKQN